MSWLESLSRRRRELEARVSLTVPSETASKRNIDNEQTDQKQQQVRTPQETIEQLLANSSFSDWRKIVLDHERDKERNFIKWPLSEDEKLTNCQAQINNNCNQDDKSDNNIKQEDKEGEEEEKQFTSQRAQQSEQTRLMKRRQMAPGSKSGAVCRLAASNYNHSDALLLIVRNCLLLPAILISLAMPHFNGGQGDGQTALAMAASSQQQYFEVQPEAQYLTPMGQNVRFRCIVRNRQGECVWLRNGRVLAPIARKYQFIRAPEDGDCSLSISNVSVALDDGRWQCQVLSPEIDQDALQTRDVNLIVLVPPEKPQIKNLVSINKLMSVEGDTFMGSL